MEFDNPIERYDLEEIYSNFIERSSIFRSTCICDGISPSGMGWQKSA